MSELTSGGEGIELLKAGLETSFIDASRESQEAFRSRMIANSRDLGFDLLSVIKSQLADCDSFDFCVAFVAESGLSCLVQVLAELRRRGVRGRFLTSTYLNFNSPAAFRKLLEYDNIEVRVFQGSMHAKGYLFEREGVSTVIIGSSNLTQSALTCNKEWNVLFRSFDRGDILRGVRAEFDALWDDESTVALTPQWIAGYEAFKARDHRAREKAVAAYRDSEPLEAIGRDGETLRPNKMQELALAALDVLHRREEPRALLVSATGTGKTYLSAFDVARVKPKRILFLAHRKRILDASLGSYKRLLGDAYSYGVYRAGSDGSDFTCTFAMCSTIVRYLDQIDLARFDYIVIDEAHRTGSSGYQKIMEHFSPRFFLGMTATPNRTDGYDVFGLFNHVIAYQITLQDALENEMLVPFHYYGIADLAIDYEETDDFALFNRLTSSERVRHITQKIEEYTVNKKARRGLVFCNRNDEARCLSDAFNRLGYRTLALSGENSDEERDRAIERLESGEIEYIFSVDIFNEGIDIPSVNQIIMLRKTESAIVFVQQLGRGLRKDAGKEYTLVLDFIGNYQKNFFVPVALSGDRTYNKDRLRTIVNNGSSVIPGASTVSFDRVSEAQIYRAIDGGDFTAARFLKGEYQGLRQMLGTIPSLMDFDRNDSIDPLLIFKKFGSYHAFLSKYEGEYKVSFSDRQCGVLKFLSQKLANGKRFEDLFMLRELVAKHGETSSGLVREARIRRGVVSRASIFFSAANVLGGGFSASKDFVPLVMHDDDGYHLMREFSKMLDDSEFKRQVVEVLDFGLHRNADSYGETYKDTSFVLNAKYTYEEVCRLLGWEKNVNGQNIGGYMYNAKTNTFPVFINYDKAPDISDTIRYEDRFVSSSELIALSKQGRNLRSPEIERLRAWPANGMRTFLFMRKNKADEGSKEFYFFGEMHPTGVFKEVMMPNTNKRAVEIMYRLEEPVRPDLYEFMMADLSGAERAR